ncbi:hypothetical protein ES703_48413 [subsurface metagenome]
MRHIVAGDIVYVNRKTQLRIYNLPETHVDPLTAYIAALDPILEVVRLIYLICGRVALKIPFRQPFNDFRALFGKFDTIGGKVVVLVGVVEIVAGLEFFAVGEKVAVEVICIGG